ncbi:MAG: urea amidolyase associated protein UAAP1 [Verrucomicrobiales bacterium]
MASAESYLYEETLPAGAMWSMVVGRHKLLELVLSKESQSPANVSALVYHARQLGDRLNVPDTLKALHTAKLSRGHVLMSDMGHALVSVTEDSVGWHDPLGGHCDEKNVSLRFGRKTYQEAHNHFYRNSHDNFLVELAKHGLGHHDLVANVNFFSKVQVNPAGEMAWIAQDLPAGSRVVLRTEMDVLVILSNCPHPMGPSGDYPQAPVTVRVSNGTPPGADDFCRRFRPECARAMTLSETRYAVL